MSDPSSTKPVQRGATRSKPSSGTRIPIRQGDVQRALEAANTVYAQTPNAAPQKGDEGVAFMTAVLLVERLATTFGCAPHAVLERMAECFELKQLYAKARRRKPQA